MKSKKFVLAIFSLLFLFLAGTFYISTLLKRGDSTPQPNKIKGETRLAPQILVYEKVVSPALSFTGETVWYLNLLGRMYRVGIAGGKTEEFLLPQLLELPKRLIWQEQGSDFIIQQEVAARSHYSYYDAERKNLIPYPAGLLQPQFVAGQNRIVYEWVNAEGGHELKVSQGDGGNYKKVTDLHRLDYQIVSSPVKDEVVLFSDNPAAFAKLMIVNLATGEFRSSGEAGVYLGARFSPDGKRLALLKGFPDLTSHLWVHDLETGKEQDLSISLENIDQMAWGKNSNSLVAATAEGFVAVNLDSGARKIVYELRESDLVKPANVIWHPNKPYLFFVDQFSGYLYRVEY